MYTIHWDGGSSKSTYCMRESTNRYLLEGTSELSLAHLQIFIGKLLLHTEFLYLTFLTNFITNTAGQ